MVWFDVLDVVWLIAAVVLGGVVGVLIAIFRGGIKGSVFGIAFGGIWLVVVAANVLGSAGGLASADFAPSVPAIGAGSIVLATVLFGFLMRAPTPAGRRLMDQIDGFRMYLDTAEKNRLNLDREPPLTIKRFEAILPFAIALGVEKPWSDKFNAALAAT